MQTRNKEKDRGKYTQQSEMAVNGVKAASIPHQTAEQQPRKYLGGFSKGRIYTTNFTTCIG